jgi:Leucine-rich repeat (LRR) protein
MLIACPNLKRLDVGFTKIRHVNVPQAIVPSLEKLVLTSTGIPGPEIIEVLGSLTKLRTLHLDAMGGGQGTAVRIDNSTAMTLSDALLRDITDTLEHATELEVLSLSGNTKLGQARHDSALSDFIARIGRRCKVCNIRQSSHSTDNVALLEVAFIWNQTPQIQRFHRSDSRGSGSATSSAGKSGY